MTGVLFFAFLMVQSSERDQLGRYIPGKYESLIPTDFRRDPERLLREAIRGGGGRETEDAVLLALGWLARTQNEDGSWDVPDERFRVEVTGLALLAFLTNRFTPCSPETRALSRGYGNRLGEVLPDASGRLREPKNDPTSFYLTVRKGLRWLIRSQAPDGFIGPRGDARSLAGHCIAATALSEAFGWTNLLVLHDPAERAVGALIAARSADGRWRCDSPEEDSVVNGWVATVLRSATLSSLPFSRSTYDGLRAWRRDAARTVGPGVPWAVDVHVVWGLWRDASWDGGAKRPIVTREQLAKEESSLHEGVPDFHRWLWDTSALFLYDGPSGPLWRRWNGPFLKAILGRQDTAAWARRGSWAPVHPEGAQGGRVHSTALNALSLSVVHTCVNVF